MGIPLHGHVVVSTQHVVSMQHLAWLSRLRNILVMRRICINVRGEGVGGVQGQGDCGVRLRMPREQFFFIFIYKTICYPYLSCHNV